MKNIVIGFVIVIVIALGAWYFLSRPAPQPTMPVRPMENGAVSEETHCPVTGEKVDPATAKLKTVYKGKTYYFCCPGCPEEFKKNPEKYLKNK